MELGFAVSKGSGQRNSVTAGAWNLPKLWLTNIVVSAPCACCILIRGWFLHPLLTICGICTGLTPSIMPMIARHILGAPQPALSHLSYSVRSMPSYWDRLGNTLQLYQEHFGPVPTIHWLDGKHSPTEATPNSRSGPITPSDKAAAWVLPLRHQFSFLR